jgi:ribonucleoside-diphosphate reductase beta chain
MTPGLLTPRRAYKPIAYPWALEACRQQHRIHWLPEEAQLGDDVRDWSGRGETPLTDPERAFLTNVFRFFTQSDVEVSDCYQTRYAAVFQPPEVRMMLASFASMETVHILAYALLLETLGLPDSEFSAFLDIPAMADKVDYMATFGVGSVDDILRTTAMFGGATEGLSLYSMFAMLMNFPRRKRMKGMGQIVSWSVRDESLHAASIILLHNTLAQEVGGRSPAVEDDIRGIFSDAVRMEDAFIHTAFDVGGEVEGLTAAELKAYVRFVADWRLRQLRLEPLFGGAATNPLPWLQSMLSGIEYQNFFEGRATEYSKGASRGSWYGDDGVWAAFDRTPHPRHARDAKVRRDPSEYERIP